MKKISMMILLFFTSASIFAGYSRHSGSRSYSSGYSSRSYSSGSSTRSYGSSYSSKPSSSYSYTRPTQPITNTPKTYTQQSKPMPSSNSVVKTSNTTTKTGIVQTESKTSNLTNTGISSQTSSNGSFYSNWWIYLMLFGNSNSTPAVSDNKQNEKQDCKNKEYFEKHKGVCKANGYGW